MMSVPKKVILVGILHHLHDLIDKAVREDCRYDHFIRILEKELAVRKPLNSERIEKTLFLEKLIQSSKSIGVSALKLVKQHSRMEK